MLVYPSLVCQLAGNVISFSGVVALAHRLQVLYWMTSGADAPPLLQQVPSSIDLRIPLKALRGSAPPSRPSRRPWPMRPVRLSSPRRPARKRRSC